MILHSAVDSQEIKGALLQKIEQAISLDGSTAPKEKDRIEDSPGWIARSVDYVKNGWNHLTGSPNSTTHPKIQRTMNLDIQGNSGFGGPRGGGPRGAGGHVDSGGGYRGDGGNGSAKSGGNAKESPSFFERFTGWLDHKWNSLTTRFKGGGGSNASGGKPPKGDKGSDQSEGKGWSMPKGGTVINGRKYTEHALERMAPDTSAVRARLEKRAMQKAEKKGYKPGTQKYNDFIRDYVQPRGIPPSVVENAIRNGSRKPGIHSGTWEYRTKDVRVITNESGDVITVIPK